MSDLATSYENVRSESRADQLALENDCTHRSDLIAQGSLLGYIYWISFGDGKRAVEKAVYYRHMKALDVWAIPKEREPLPEDAQPIGEEK